MVPALSRGAADVQQRKEIVSGGLLFPLCFGGCLIFRHIDTHNSKHEHAAGGVLEDELCFCFCSWLLHHHEIHEISLDLIRNSK